MQIILDKVHEIVYNTLVSKENRAKIKNGKDGSYIVMNKKFDLTGQRFCKLTVLYELPERNKKKQIMWVCKCDCGNLTTVCSSDLRDGGTKSCGCLRGGYNKKHEKSNTRLYNVWHAMKQRCNYPKAESYHNYGGRGIRVCPEWESDFAAFEQWALENGYDENAPRGQCTLDRIDVDGNYCHENCRWVDMKTQANNKRNSKKIEDGT